MFRFDNYHRAILRTFKPEEDWTASEVLLARTSLCSNVQGISRWLAGLRREGYVEGRHRVVKRVKVSEWKLTPKGESVLK